MTDLTRYQRSVLRWLLRECVRRTGVSIFYYFFAGWIANEQKQYLSLHSNSQVPISRDLWGQSKISRAGLSAASSKWVIRDDTNAWCWLPATRFPDHMTPDPSTTPAALGVNDEGKDVTFCCAAETDDVQRTGHASVFARLHNEWLTLRPGFPTPDDSFVFLVE